ncbi:hypothetical protein [Gemmatimonas aurantiaca]
MTKRGASAARVVRGESAAPSAFGFLAGTLLSASDLVSPDHDSWSEE